MSVLPHDWPIKHRADSCALTQRPFAPGEEFYTLLFRESDAFRREDLSEQAWSARNDNIRPFSFWKSRYEPVPPAAPDALAKENVEELLRSLLIENDPAHGSACYVLAAMLERKRVLKHVKSEDTPDGRVSIYEHAENGDLFVVRDPQLRLDQLDSVQAAVAALLKSSHLNVARSEG